jgi:RNA polymerase sigma-70 factor, ECF subfamily
MVNAFKPQIQKEAVTVTELQKREQNPMCDNAISAAAGDVAAFARLIEAHQGMLYRVCRTILSNDADCADAVQETVIVAWKHIGHLRNAESFPAWLARICINRCYRIARSRRQPVNFSEPVAESTHNDTRLDVLSAVLDLPEELRLAVVFYYYEDWSIEDTARVLRTFPGTVKSRLHRARQQLAMTLKDYKEVIRNDAR